MRAPDGRAPDEPFVLQDDLDSSHRLYDGFAENQFFHGFQFALDCHCFVEIACAASQIHGRPFFRGEIRYSDEGAAGADPITFGDEAVVPREHFHRGVFALQLFDRLGEKIDIERGFFECHDFLQSCDAADGFNVIPIAFDRHLEKYQWQMGLARHILEETDLEIAADFSPGEEQRREDHG